MMLHANLIYFNHPKSGERVEIVAPPFEDMRGFLSKNFLEGDRYANLNQEDFNNFFSRLRQLLAICSLVL